MPSPSLLTTTVHFPREPQGGVVDNGVNYIVTEFMEGGSLMDYLNDKESQSLEQSLRIALNISMGVNYLHWSHKPPLIHADLKPENILLTSERVAKLADFGNTMEQKDGTMNGFVVRSGEIGCGLRCSLLRERERERESCPVLCCAKFVCAEWFAFLVQVGVGVLSLRGCLLVSALSSSCSTAALNSLRSPSSRSHHTCTYTYTRTHTTTYNTTTTSNNNNNNNIK
jgi:serine/threonine protein kinase